MKAKVKCRCKCKQCEQARTSRQKSQDEPRLSFGDQCIEIFGGMALAMRETIPPYKLLPYLDEAMMALSNEGVQSELQEMVRKALTILVNITEEDVKRDPRVVINEEAIADQ